MEELMQEITRLNAERARLLQDYDPMTYASKRSRIHDLDERIAALFAKKRTMTKASYTKDSY